jgi:DNA-binding response OmpR family regulator
MKKILIIDDNEQFNKMLCMILAQAGYEVSTATNGDSGLKLYRQERPDLIITDIYMPEKEGLETIMELRATDCQTRILVVSGGSPQMNLADMFNMAKIFGADAMLAKPFDMDHFLKTVQGLLAEG